MAKGRQKDIIPSSALATIVSKPLAAIFEVSEQAIKSRLKKDGLLNMRIIKPFHVFFRKTGTAHFPANQQPNLRYLRNLRFPKKLRNHHFTSHPLQESPRQRRIKIAMPQESEQQTRKRRIDARLCSMTPPWQIIRHQDGQDNVRLHGVAVEEYDYEYKKTTSGHF